MSYLSYDVDATGVLDSNQRHHPTQEENTHHTHTHTHAVDGCVRMCVFACVCVVLAPRERERERLLAYLSRAESIRCLRTTATHTHVHTWIDRKDSDKSNGLAELLCIIDNFMLSSCASVVGACIKVVFCVVVVRSFVVVSGSCRVVSCRSVSLCRLPSPEGCAADHEVRVAVVLRHHGCLRKQDARVLSCELGPRDT